MAKADSKIIFYNPETLMHKHLEMPGDGYIKEAFGHPDLRIINDKQELTEALMNIKDADFSLLLMSSVNFAGMTYRELTNALI